MIAYLDCSTGVSGDKFLGALIDAGTRIAERGGAGFTAEDLARTIACVAPEANVSVERVLSRGISAVGVAVTSEGDGPHRHWSDIRALLGDAVDLARRAVERGVGVVPGSPFYPDGRGGDNVRLSFSTVDEALIDEGIERLAGLVAAG